MGCVGYISVEDEPVPGSMLIFFILLRFSKSFKCDAVHSLDMYIALMLASFLIAIVIFLWPNFFPGFQLC